MADVEVIPEVMDRKPPVRQVIDGVLHVGGVRVETWQIIQDEMREFFPEKYRELYGGIEAKCPMPDCLGMVNESDKRSYRMHFMGRHREFYEKHIEELTAAEGPEGFVTYVLKATGN